MVCFGQNGTRAMLRTRSAPHLTSGMQTKPMSLSNQELISTLLPHPLRAKRLILLLAALWCAFWFVHAWHYWEDDAYIHLEFARNVSQGRGFAFNGHTVNGDTSPLWVLLLSGMHVLIPEWMIAGKVLAVLGVIFALAGVYIFSNRILEDYQSSPVFSAAMILLLVVNPYFCYWSFSGMEAVTAAGVACWGTYFITARRQSWGSWLSGCLFAGLGPVLRPEMAFFTAIAGLLLLWQWFRIPGKHLSPAKLFGFALGLLLITGPTLAWCVYAVHAFGHVIPNTNAAKRAAPGDSVLKRLLDVYLLGFPVVVCGFAAFIGYFLIRSTKVLSAIKNKKLFGNSQLAGWVFLAWVGISAVFYVVDHTYVQTRYITAMAPGLAIAIFGLLFTRFSPNLFRICYALALITAVLVSSFTVWPFIRNKAIADQTIVQLSDYIKTNLPPNAPVAVYAIGEIAFISQHPIIDTGGITRPEAIPYLNRPASDMIRWAKSEGAAYCIMGEQPEPGAVLIFSKEMPTIGWSLNPKFYARKTHILLWKLPVTPEKSQSSTLSATLPSS
jgi:hypothetical protein